MKKFKKLFAVLLAMMMVMGLATTALAAPTNKAADLTGHTYEAYQIFSGTQGADSAELGNIEWGAGVDGAAMLTALKADATIGAAFTNCTTAKDVANAMKDWTDGSAQAKAFAQIAYNNKTDVKTAVADKNTTLEAGYYLVVDSSKYVVDNQGNVILDENGKATIADENNQPVVGEDEKPIKTDYVYNLSLLQLTKKGTFDIVNKTDVPEVEKVIVEGANEVKLNEKGMGKVNTYKITGTLPTNLADYEAYFYWFNDTLSKGLTVVEPEDDSSWVKVEVVNNGTPVDVTQYFYANKTTDTTTKETTISVAIADVKALDTLNGVTVNKDTKIVVTYKAVVNQDAVIAGEGNPNDVDLRYSNNPDNSGRPVPPTPGPGEPTTEHPTGVTPKDRVVTYLTELTIQKTDEKGNPLTGAQFTLECDDMVAVNVKTTAVFEADENGAYWKLANGTYTKVAPIDDKYEEGWDASMDGAAEHLTVKNNHADYDSTTAKYSLKDYTSVEYVTATRDPLSVTKSVDANGLVTFSGLGKGSYTLKETVTPDGFNTIAPIKFEITFNTDDHKFSATAPITVEADNTLYTEVINLKGNTLPETGGMGTTIFYVVGAVLVLGAGVLLITKKRMAA